MQSFPSPNPLFITSTSTAHTSSPIAQEQLPLYAVIAVTAEHRHEAATCYGCMRDRKVREMKELEEERTKSRQLAWVLSIVGWQGHSWGSSSEVKVVTVWVGNEGR